MTSTTTTYHDIEPFAIEGNGMASARCLTHMTATAEQWPTLSGAARGFACDEGSDLRFVTEFHGADIEVIPVMRDLSGLARIIRGDAEAHAYGQDYGETRAWLWTGEGQTEPLTIRLADMTGFDEDDYARQAWQVTGDDGRVILEVSVRIDGRA